MKIILDEDKYNAIWDKIDRDFSFSPSCKADNDSWLSFPMKSKKYRLNHIFPELLSKWRLSFLCII